MPLDDPDEGADVPSAPMTPWDKAIIVYVLLLNQLMLSPDSTEKEEQKMKKALKKGTPKDIILAFRKGYKRLAAADYLGDHLPLYQDFHMFIWQAGYSDRIVRALWLGNHVTNVYLEAYDDGFVSHDMSDLMDELIIVTLGKSKADIARVATKVFGNYIEILDYLAGLWSNGQSVFLDDRFRSVLGIYQKLVGSFDSTPFQPHWGHLSPILDVWNRLHQLLLKLSGIIPYQVSLAMDPAGMLNQYYQVYGYLLKKGLALGAVDVNQVDRIRDELAEMGVITVSWS